MSNLVITEVNGKKKGKLEGVTLAYIKLQEGSFKYQSKEKEYTVDIIVDKPTAKEFKKQFPKNGYKEIDTKDFEGKYKIAPPYPAEDEQFVIKLKSDVALAGDVGQLKAGDPIPYEWNARPKLFVPVEGGVEDVTMSVLAANGSKGSVAFNILTNSYGTFPQLSGVLVTHLIEYEGGGGSSSDFGEVVGGYKAGNGETQQKAETVVEDQDSSSDNSTSFDDFGDIPF